MKTKSFRLLLSFCMAFVLLAAFQKTTRAADPIKLKIGYSTWVGYGPLFIARDKGFFAANGLDVELVKVEDPKQRFVALAGKQLDGLVSTLDTLSQYWKTDAPFEAILGLDESSGGDGIVAGPDIKTVKDLKGKNIGVNVGSVSQFLLEYVLQQNGMTDKDVTLVKMQQGDVPAALAANRVDAGVTWEPHLTKSVKNGATLVMTSKDTPGLIVDVLIMRGDVLTANPTVGPALVDAWNKSIDYWKASPDDADLIMQKGLAGFYETPADIKADLAGATLFDAEHNQKFFGSTGEGTATSTMTFAIDLYTKLGIITTPVKAEDMIDATWAAPAMAATPDAMMEATMEATVAK
ncbi:MAG: ABC transporter substrate-binding protein [Chloroflexota bacterium]